MVRFRIHVKGRANGVAERLDVGCSKKKRVPGDSQ